MGVAPITDKPQAVLTKAALNAGKELGLTDADIRVVIGYDPSAPQQGIELHGKTGEAALLLVRLYQSLHVLLGGNNAAMSHWMVTFNLHIGGVPRELVRTSSGLVEVVNYLEAFRHR